MKVLSQVMNSFESERYTSIYAHIYMYIRVHMHIYICLFTKENGNIYKAGSTVLDISTSVNSGKPHSRIAH